jgi:hypothetical protein
MAIVVRLYSLCIVTGLLAGCSNQQQPEVLLPGIQSTDAELFGEVVTRWQELGYPLTAEECFESAAETPLIPREIFVEPDEFQDMCRSQALAPGMQCPDEECALGCTAAAPDDGGPLLVFVDGWQDSDMMRLLRAHEALHWLADCSMLATAWANLNHAVPGVWAPMVKGAPYVMEQFENPEQ